MNARCRRNATPRLRSLIPGLLAAAVAVTALACQEEEDFRKPRGACAVRWDHMGEHPDGPYNCHSDFSEESCGDLNDEFYPRASCGEAGFSFCCETEFTTYQFRTFEDAAWYDELSDPAHAYQDCADNQVACEDQGFEEEGEQDEADEGGDDDNADECSSDSSCGSRKECRSGQCVSVECTSDSHCGSCSRCSDNVCRDCGSGPYGCYC